MTVSNTDAPPYQANALTTWLLHSTEKSKFPLIRNKISTNSDPSKPIQLFKRSNHVHVGLRRRWQYQAELAACPYTVTRVCRDRTNEVANVLYLYVSACRDCSSLTFHTLIIIPNILFPVMLILFLVLKDSLRTYFKSLSLSLGVRSLFLSLFLRSLSLSWSLWSSPCPCSCL